MGLLIATAARASSDPPVAAFLEQLQSDIAGVGDVQVWRTGLFLLVGAALGLYIRLLYDRMGQSAADAGTVSRVFPLLVVVTTCIIAVIKSSLALSLGLVGALSIVRFRAAIKDPEELVYLFLCIGVGLCLGAEQLVLAVLSVIAVTLLVIATRLLGKSSPRHTAILTITGDSSWFGEPENRVLDAVRGLPHRHCIQRYDVQEGEGQLRLLLARILPDEASTLMDELRRRLPSCELSYVNLDGAT